jgi:hypothetical protein
MADRDTFLSVGVQFHPGIEAHRRVLLLLRRKRPCTLHRYTFRTRESLCGEKMRRRVEEALRAAGGDAGGLSTARLTKRVLGPRIGAGEHASAPWLMSSTGMPMSGEP